MAQINLFPGSAFLFKKVMLVISSVNQHQEVTTQDFEAALAFIRWQARVREVFRPSQADDAGQAKFNELVIRAVRREDGRLAKYPVASRWVNVQPHQPQGVGDVLFTADTKSDPA